MLIPCVRVETVGTWGLSTVVTGRVFGLSGIGFYVVDRFIGIIGTKSISDMYSGVLNPYQTTIYGNYGSRKRTRFVILPCLCSLESLLHLNSVAVAEIVELPSREQQRRDLISIQLSNHLASAHQRITKSQKTKFEY